MYEFDPSIASEINWVLCKPKNLLAKYRSEQMLVIRPISPTDHQPKTRFLKKEHIATSTPFEHVRRDAWSEFRFVESGTTYENQSTGTQCVTTAHTNA